MPEPDKAANNAFESLDIIYGNFHMNQQPVGKLMAFSIILITLLSGLVIWETHNSRIVKAEETTAQATQKNDNNPTTLNEARGRARLLHETIHGTLQVVHRDFFREDESLVIPSHSLEDVFKELARSYNVKVRWLAVNAKAMNIDNEPKSPFELDAAKALAKGQREFEKYTKNSYQFAGPIRLPSQCLKCHLPSRTSNKDRIAGLTISMPLKKP